MVAFIFGVLAFTLDDLSLIIYQSKIQRLRQSNERLETQISRLQRQSDTMAQVLRHLEQRDRAVRTYAGISGIGQDLREIGIGGTRYDRTREYDYLLSSEEPSITDLQIITDSLTSKIKLEDHSYAELDSLVKAKQDHLTSMPAIRLVYSRDFTDGFGYRSDPFTRRRRFHYGLDISADRGDPVLAAEEGAVEYASWKYGYGRMVRIDHGQGYETIYAHNSELLVQPDDQVRRGDTIALAGNSGRSTGPHLHYEVLKNGNPVDPLNFFYNRDLK
ncbi:MAG TPA: M23 family metallopeptidase [bacterium]|nr:M23 family metallopeptidase [bacterium]